MKKQKIGGFGFYMLVLVAIGIIWYFVSTMGNDKIEYNYSNFLSDLKENNIEKVIVEQGEKVPTGSLEITFKGENKTKVVYVTDVNDALDAMMAEKFYEYKILEVEGESIFINVILPLGISVLTIIIIFVLFSGQSAGGNGSKMMNFGKSRAKLMNDTGRKMTFADVAGLSEEKEDLEEIVDFLRNPKKYIEVGARIPKGVILEGPPGTGKTLLAKAIAGEAEVPFFTISGSDFVEMFVGVGASRVRDLFEEAKKNAPSIIFIDEIDAVARRRGTGMGGGHDEREQTLNQMLVEMDGFGVNEGIIVLAATNRVDILDPAILRPGRFDRRIHVSRPDVKGRREILDVHVKNKPLGDDVDLDNIAQTTAGFTGADLENLLNEAAIYAAKKDRKFIIQEDINRSFIKVGIGTEKKSKVISGVAIIGALSVLAYKYLNISPEGITLSAPIFQQFNPFYVVALTPFSMALFGALAKKGKEPSAPRKIAYGMVVATIAYVVMAVASIGLLTPNAQELARVTGDATFVNANVLIYTYLILTFAELLLSPMGISFVSKVAPPKYKGMMMGGWFVATAIGNYLVSIGSNLWGDMPLWGVWSVFIAVCLIAALFMFGMMKKLEDATK